MEQETKVLLAKTLPYDFTSGAEFLLQALKDTGYGVGSLVDDVLTLHSCGWSDAEEIIEGAMLSTWWQAWWYSSTVGGHYVFKKKCY